MPIENRKYSCIVIDDEFLARKLLADYISKIPQFELIGSFDSAVSAIELISTGAVDVIFTDIEMPDMSGMDFIKNLQTTSNQPLIVFVTAYPQYAVEGFEVSATEYLLKPVSFPRFIKAVNKIINTLNLHNRISTIQKTEIVEVKQEIDDNNYIVIKVDGRIVKLLFDEIIYVEGALEYVIFHTKDEKYMTLMSLRNLESELPEERFMRIHKSYIVAIDKIQEIEGNMVSVGKNKITVSKNMRPVLLKRFSGE